MKHSIKEWVLATRPWSFTASAMPVLVSAAWLFAQDESVNWLLVFAALINIVLVHAAGNVWSDYHDFRSGVDNANTYGTKNLTSGLFTPQEALRLSVGLNIVAVILGCTIVALTGLTLLWIGIIGIALSLLYPPLKYHALGDIVIIFCYAILPMIGTTFIANGTIHWDVLWMAPPVGLITVAILHSNNTRDIETDSDANITTFASLTGRPVAVGIYIAEITIPYLWLTALCATGVTPWWALITFLSIPLSLRNIRSIADYKKGGIESMALLDTTTAQLQLVFSLLLIIGLSLSQLL